ncbi:Uncharacterised protein [Campylobacter upsaliensis]|nr:Uncharacterised protein [Campylobacter upsaliensis]
MGLRAYAVTHYEKEFGDCLGFNYDFSIQKDFIRLPRCNWCIL